MSKSHNSRRLWIGAVEVRPLVGCEVFDYSFGAFTNIVTWASDPYEYGHKVAQFLWSLRLFVMDIADPEPIEKKRARGGVFDELIEAIIVEAEKNTGATVLGPFYTFKKIDV